MPIVEAIEAKRSQSEFLDEFLTQKELDPDAVAFNSQNSRYNFRRRFYLPSRGLFGQLDLLRQPSLPPPYLLRPRTSGPVIPSGLAEGLQQSVPQGANKASGDHCPCGVEIWFRHAVSKFTGFQHA